MSALLTKQTCFRWNRFLVPLLLVMTWVVPVGLLRASPITIEAEASDNTLSGAAVVADCSGCSGGAKVGYIGNGSANYVTINNINVGAGDSYQLTIYYLVDGTRSFFVSINDGDGVELPLSGTSWSTPASTSITVPLNAGSNRIRFYNDSAYAPDLDRVEVSPTPVDKILNPTNGNVRVEYDLNSGTATSTGTGPGRSPPPTACRPVALGARWRR